MKDRKDLIEAIKNRGSVRTYSPKGLPSHILTEIRELLRDKVRPPFGSEIRLSLIDAKRLGDKDPKKIGTYGIIKGARYYIAGAVKESKKHLEDYGYVFENIILGLTDMGLGTCWLGGTFNKSSFFRILDCSQEETIPAVTPVGYGIKKKSLIDKSLRFMARSDKRLPWERLFFDYDGDKALEKDKAGKFLEALEMVRLAPSSSNNQPWRIFFDNKYKRFDFFINSRTSPLDDSFRTRLKRIDIGIAMCHFDSVLKVENIIGKWHTVSSSLKKERGSIYIASWQQA